MRELDQDRADTAGRAGHQQMAPGSAAARHAEAVEQQLPGGDRGQRQRCGFGVGKRLWRMADQTRVHALEFGIAAGPIQRAGIPDPIAGLEDADLAADRVDDADRVPAEDARCAMGGCGVAPNFGVDRVHRHCPHRHPQILRAGLRHGGVKRDQRLGMVDGQGLAEADGFHCARG